MPLRLARSHPLIRHLHLDVPKRQKFNARPVLANGQRFGSEKEYARFCELVMMQRAGLISGLVAHPIFHLFGPNGRYVGKMTPDAFYVLDGQCIAEDTKGGKATKTEAYSLRLRLFRANYPTIRFVET